MRLIIHPGYGKTATTWLQSRGLPQAGVWLLAKGSAGDGTEGHCDERLHDLQYRVFSPVEGPASMWVRFRDSAPAVREYARSLAHELDEAAAGRVPASAERQRVRDTQLAVLSDETIVSYGGPEINAGLLAYFVTALRRSVAAPDELAIEVVLTIREQSSFLRSFYAYDFAHQRRRHRTFESFLAAGARDPHAGVFGTLFYDDAHDLLVSTLPPFVQVRLVPYELLSQGPPGAYLTAFLGAELDAGAGTEPEGVNQQQESGYRLRDFSRRHRAVKALQAAASVAPPPFGRLLQAATETRLARSLLPSEPTRVLDRRVELTDEQRNRIRELYAESNANLDSALSLGLRDLGYAVAGG